MENTSAPNFKKDPLDQPSSLSRYPISTAMKKIFPLLPNIS